MAKFSLAYKNTEAIEKGYTVDNGGETYKGISWNAWKNDALVQKIFAMVRAAKPQRGDIINSAALDALIVQFYKQNYWDRIYGDRLSNQILANFCYDFYVNSNSAPSIINQAIGARGSIGFTESTLAQLNDKPAWCYLAIVKARKAWYEKLAAKNPKFKKNNTYRGWMARLNSFPQSLTA